jgi:hypothetical protein
MTGVGAAAHSTVMPALVAGIHALLDEKSESEDVDGRDKPGHDGKISASCRPHYQSP